MGKLYRAISADGSAFAEVLDAKDIVSEIERIHKTSAVVTAGLGRLSIAASLMGYMLKGEDDSITLRVDGGGPAGEVLPGIPGPPGYGGDLPAPGSGEPGAHRP